MLLENHTPHPEILQAPRKRQPSDARADDIDHAHLCRRARRHDVYDFRPFPALQSTRWSRMKSCNSSRGGAFGFPPYGGEWIPQSDNVQTPRIELLLHGGNLLGKSARESRALVLDW